MTLVRIVLLLLWSLCSCAPALGAADKLRVTVVLSDSNALYQNFTNTFKQNLPANILVGVVDRAEDYSAAQTADLVLTVGTRAADWVAGKTTTPLLATMIPKGKYADFLAKRPPGALTTAIYLDHSWARQADLLRAALPERNRIGLLHSPSTRVDINELRKQLAKHGAVLVTKQTTGPNKLFEDLDEVLSRSDVLLALPDGEIYNSNNIRNILLSSYNRSIPLVGFSQALVNAGALFALYSTPEQLAAQTSSTVNSYAQLRRLPEPQHPILFSISVNPEVARTLGGSIKSAELLRLEVDKLQRIAP